MRKLQCNVCKKNFRGRKGTMYCSNNCKNTIKRDRRNKKNQEISRKETNRKYYLKNKYLLTKKYKNEQRHREQRKKENNKKWNLNNKNKCAKYRRDTKIRQRIWFDKHKEMLKCEICGYNKCPTALDFHHKDPQEKEFSIAKGIGRRYPKERILKEIEKCFILCSNCHRELHHKEDQEKIKENRRAYLEGINKPKNIYYSIIERELEKEWFKELQDKAKYNLARFGGNQFIKVNNGIKEKIDTKIILSQKAGIGINTINRALQIYRRGNEEQKERARTGKSSISKVWKELEPIRHSKRIDK